MMNKSSAVSPYPVKEVCMATYNICIQMIRIEVHVYF